jgi:hypothetical protein
MTHSPLEAESVLLDDDWVLDSVEEPPSEDPEEDFRP